MFKNYFAGMEETVGRFLSFFATLVFFSIYILSKDKDNYSLSLDWSRLMIHLAIFWFVYELIGYILFLILMQFSKNKTKQSGVSIPPTSIQESTPEDTINN
jgi:hypothetical protein